MLKFSKDFKKAMKVANVTENQFVNYCDDNFVELSMLITEDGCYKILDDLIFFRNKINKTKERLTNLFKSFNPNNQ